MSLLSIARDLLARRYRGGVAARLIPVDPPDTPEEIQSRLGGSVPLEIEELLELGAGIEIDGVEVRWDGNVGLVAMEEILPRSVSVMEDGFGNFWNVDIDPESGAWGPVYYLCHDPPVVVLQASSFAEFLDQFGDEFEREGGGTITQVHDRTAMEIYRTGGLAAPAERLNSANDPVLEDVLERCGPDVLVCDMRDAHPGEGFRWVSEQNEQVEVLRPRREPVFIIGPPAQPAQALEPAGQQTLLEIAFEPLPVGHSDVRFTAFGRSLTVDSYYLLIDPEFQRRWPEVPEDELRRRALHALCSQWRGYIAGAQADEVLLLPFGFSDQGMTHLRCTFGSDGNVQLDLVWSPDNGHAHKPSDISTIVTSVRSAEPVWRSNAPVMREELLNAVDSVLESLA